MDLDRRQQTHTSTLDKCLAIPIDEPIRGSLIAQTWAGADPLPCVHPVAVNASRPHRRTARLTAAAGPGRPCLPAAAMKGDMCAYTPMSGTSNGASDPTRRHMPAALLPDPGRSVAHGPVAAASFDLIPGRSRTVEL